MIEHAQQENDLLRKEIRVLHEAAELTANLVIEQFEQTEREKLRVQEGAARLEGFKRTLDQISDCVFMFDPETLRFTYFNYVALEHTGYSEEELYAMSFADFGLSFTQEKLTAALENLIVNPLESMLLETTVKRKNDIVVPVEIFVQYISPRGTKGRFFSIVRNISERLLAEKEKERMQAKMLHTQKMESVGELAAGIAHEINSPIQFIGANLSFMDEAFMDLCNLIEQCRELVEAVQQDKSTERHIESINTCMEDIDLPYLLEEIPQAIHQADEGVQRVSKLVKAMKEFSHPGSKEKQLADINTIIQTTIQIAHNELKYCTDIDLDLAENLPRILCHSNDIGQVILNLLLNAADSIKERLEIAPNSPKGLIGIKTLQAESQITIQITDNGSGIPDEIINRIFDPFFTTKEVGKGTGQGLAITRDVIRNKHGGEIQVESEQGAGTVFTVILPFDR